MAASSSPDRPYMGKEEFDTEDPDLEGKLQAIELRARQFGSAVVQVQYPGMPLQVFIGTNHPYSYDANTIGKI